MSSEAPTVGSLFAGIGGFDLGFEWAGFAVRWQIENDPFCNRVLAHHWPTVQRHGDVRAVRGVDLAPVDWIIGGFPCQDLSSAGTRVGLTGPRSGLYREFLRIIDESGPSGVVIENSGHAWRQWVPHLRRALWARGYTSLPLHMRARDFGAWHIRHRVYLVAHVDQDAVRVESWRRCWPFWDVAPIFADAHQARPADTRRVDAYGGLPGLGAITPNAGGLGQRSEGQAGIRARQSDTERRTPVGDERCGCWDRNAFHRTVGMYPSERCINKGHLANADEEGELQSRRVESDEWRRPSDSAWWPAEPDVDRVLYGVPSRAYGRWLSDRVGAQGNAVCPPLAYWIAKTIREVTA
jgi:DNA (cytosine-5)-methyltransferase 1